MKRWTVRILLCLFLGAVTTVVVAWSVQLLFRPVPVDDMDKSVAAQRLRKWFLHESITVAHSHGISAARFGWDEWEVLYQRDVEEDSHLELLVRVISTGWPLRCFSGSIKWEYRGAIGFQMEELHGTFFLPDAWNRDLQAFIAFIPYHPIWPGFVIDTLFYAAIWGGVWFGFVGGKRFIRIKRGRCPRRGYDLRGALSGGCPECGFGRESQPNGWGRAASE